jgi:hypothetical protein
MLSSVGRSLRILRNGNSPRQGMISQAIRQFVSYVMLWHPRNRAMGGRKSRETPACGDSGCKRGDACMLCRASNEGSAPCRGAELSRASPESNLMGTSNPLETRLILFEPRHCWSRIRLPQDRFFQMFYSSLIASHAVAATIWLCGQYLANPKNDATPLTLEIIHDHCS